MTINLGDVDVGVAILYGKKSAKIPDVVDPKVANLVPLREQRSLNRSAMRSPGNHS